MFGQIREYMVQLLPKNTVLYRHLFWRTMKPRTEADTLSNAGLALLLPTVAPQKEAFMRAILFVDDHEVLARLSCEILEMQGYRAVSAYNGADALKKFDEDDFDILVTDFRMDGMNGVELARRVHEKNPDVPVIIVTGYGPVEGGKDVAACLQKEDLFPALLEKIRMFLGERETRPRAVKTA
jgi:CheY-like chemotaxis protein